MLIVNLPIEDLDERYSKQWNKWFADYAKKYNCITINPPLPIRKGLPEGGFLDAIGTTFYKSHQIAEVASKVASGEIPRDSKVVFLIQDGWFPVEQLAYMRDMLKCRYWKFVGIWHDGTYDEWDLTARNNMYIWGEDLENSWFKIYDKIVVGSYYHANVLSRKRKVDPINVYIIPWHVAVPSLDITNKKNIIVFRSEERRVGK